MNITKLFLTVLGICLLNLNLQSVHASGAYVPPSGGSSLADYNKGKALFNGRTKIGDLPSCKSCHKNKQKLQRKKLKKILADLNSVIVNCDIHTSCYKETLNAQQLSLLVSYIVKRYRLK
jgi:hypothetical protein